ncbi:LysM peptidoglycan-binding domain-containing protein [Ornithinimicrobium cavernae]|uniref:LysM peptidoglycan-binding domain-containing protein n=1 Tax=Ornithinimicrobium cavernae TaxID=2666047 RepID=UPI000D6961CE|nr:LysM peptidoglycan-binding domain-containing protein [Ornithinimicrobium cavernae]
MSAIALHDILQDLEPVPAGRSPRRRNHLRVVAPGETAPVSARAARPSRGLVLTRRGRLTVTLTVATVLVLAVVAALGMFPAAADGGQTVVVQPGQTLSQIAVTELPELPVDRAIVQIQLANGLNSLHIQAGAELEIPRP